MAKREARSASAMPGFLMPSHEADAVVAYLMSLKARKVVGIPHTHPSRGVWARIGKRSSRVAQPIPGLRYAGLAPSAPVGENY
jgi:hypothetical protein